MAIAERVKLRALESKTFYRDVKKFMAIGIRPEDMVVLEGTEE